MMQTKAHDIEVIHLDSNEPLEDVDFATEFKVGPSPGKDPDTGKVRFFMLRFVYRITQSNHVVLSLIVEQVFEFLTPAEHLTRDGLMEMLHLAYTRFIDELHKQSSDNPLIPSELNWEFPDDEEVEVMLTSLK